MSDHDPPQLEPQLRRWKIVSHMIHTLRRKKHRLRWYLDTMGRYLINAHDTPAVSWTAVFMSTRTSVVKRPCLRPCAPSRTKLCGVIIFHSTLESFPSTWSEVSSNSFCLGRLKSSSSSSPNASRSLNWAVATYFPATRSE